MLSLNSISGSSVIDMEDTQTLPSKAFPYNEELTHKPSEPVGSQLFQVELQVHFENGRQIKEENCSVVYLRRFHDLAADLEAGPAFIASPSFSPEDTEPTSSCHKASDSAGLHTEHQMMSYNSPLCTILVGDSGVGKTSLLVQFDQGKFISGSFTSTVGIGFTEQQGRAQFVAVELPQGGSGFRKDARKCQTGRHKAATRAPEDATRVPKDATGCQRMPRGRQGMPQGARGCHEGARGCHRVLVDATECQGMPQVPEDATGCQRMPERQD
ncbi:hypothetical protein AMECASPLE_016321 [Ameca splendens]|uniref:Ras-related protein Rab-26 n=1 Tax=Ameca splendens TaxID=208324 RepID=A0ABV0ZXX6_9TELE